MSDVCVCVSVSRSDSDSEGENPEKKKLQEQLMGKEICRWLLSFLVDNCFVLQTVAHQKKGKKRRSRLFYLYEMKILSFVFL